MGPQVNISGSKYGDCEPNPHGNLDGIGTLGHLDSTIGKDHYANQASPADTVLVLHDLLPSNSSLLHSS